MKLKIAYFGTPDFSARFLKKIINDKDLPADVTLVVTQPDRPLGRKQTLTPSPVKEVAKRFNINTASPPSASPPSQRGEIKRGEKLSYLLARLDLALLYAYGEIIPADLLKLPKYGFWNLHPSLLPRYRGASPIAYPLLLGDRKTGVTLIQMDTELDHGPIIAQQQMTIDRHDRRRDLEEKLTMVGFELFKQTLRNLPLNPPPYQGGGLGVVSKPQDDHLATYTRRLTNQDGFIPLQVLKKALNKAPLKESEIPSLVVDYHRKNSINEWLVNPEKSAKLVYDYFRGLYPWPGIWTTVNIKGKEKRLKITDMSADALHVTRYPPASPKLSFGGRGMLRVKRVQLEGKREVDFEQFKQAYPRALG